jgi:hypothetical protein
MKEWSFASTPPIGHTACTEPQCLFKGALPKSQKSADLNNVLSDIWKFMNYKLEITWKAWMVA